MKDYEDAANSLPNLDEMVAVVAENFEQQKKHFAVLVNQSETMDDRSRAVAFQWFKSGADWQLHRRERLLITEALATQAAEIERLRTEVSRLTDASRAA